MYGLKIVDLVTYADSPYTIEFHDKIVQIDTTDGIVVLKFPAHNTTKEFIDCLVIKTKGSNNITCDFTTNSAKLNGVSSDDTISTLYASKRYISLKTSGLTNEYISR